MLSFHVGQLELDPLELVDRLAELLALARVGDGVVSGALRDPDRLGGCTEARTLQGAERDTQPSAHLADHVLLGHAYVLEDRLTGRRGADTELVLKLANAEARAVGLDDERRDSFALAVGHREGDVEICHAQVRDPVLGAVDDPFIVVLHRGRLHSRRIGPCFWLG